MPYIAIGRIIQVFNEHQPKRTILYLVSDKGVDEFLQGRISLKTALAWQAEEKICNVYAPS